jgi:hypothetical protein
MELVRLLINSDLLLRSSDTCLHVVHVRIMSVRLRAGISSPAEGL